MKIFVLWSEMRLFNSNIFFNYNTCLFLNVQFINSAGNALWILILMYLFINLLWYSEILKWIRLMMRINFFSKNWNFFSMIIYLDIQKESTYILSDRLIFNIVKNVLHYVSTIAKSLQKKLSTLRNFFILGI